MAVKIRLRRMGNTNNPFYRIVVADSRSPAKGKFLETIGWYDPKIQDASADFKLDLDRLDYWTGCGAQLSTTVGNLVKKARNAPPVVTEEAPAVEEAPAAEEAVAPAEA